MPSNIEGWKDQFRQLAKDIFLDYEGLVYNEKGEQKKPSEIIESFIAAEIQSAEERGKWEQWNKDRKAFIDRINECALKTGTCSTESCLELHWRPLMILDATKPPPVILIS